MAAPKTPNGMTRMSKRSNIIFMYKRMLQSILKIGLPAGFEAIMYSISNIIVQVSINNFGVDTMAAWTAYYIHHADTDLYHAHIIDQDSKQKSLRRH